METSIIILCASIFTFFVTRTLILGKAKNIKKALSLGERVTVHSKVNKSLSNNNFFYTIEKENGNILLVYSKQEYKLIFPYRHYWNGSSLEERENT